MKKKKSELNESRLVLSSFIVSFEKEKIWRTRKKFSRHLKNYHIEHFSQFNERTRSYSLIIRFSKE